MRIVPRVGRLMQATIGLSGVFALTSEYRGAL
jgi:hypothetical protein